FWKRMVRGNPALCEFRRLQWLQKANAPAPRPVATLLGFVLEGRTGDAVVLEAIEPAESLATVVDEALLQGDRPAELRTLSLQLRMLLNQLNLSELGHRDLHLGNVLRSG